MRKKIAGYIYSARRRRNCYRWLLELLGAQIEGDGIRRSDFIYQSTCGPYQYHSSRMVPHRVYLNFKTHHYGIQSRPTSIISGDVVDVKLQPN